MAPLKDIRESHLQSLIRNLLWHQRQKYPDRWCSLPEVEHALFPFGDWDTFDIRELVWKMVDSGELERNDSRAFRWKVGNK